jgi:hypothetical protein
LLVTHQQRRQPRVILVDQAAVRIKVARVVVAQELLEQWVHKQTLQVVAVTANHRRLQAPPSGMQVAAVVVLAGVCMLVPAESVVVAMAEVARQGQRVLSIPAVAAVVVVVPMAPAVLVDLAS